ncbi:MAG: dethiobiotin synthase [Kofleriaceae bacterium]
MSKRYFVTGTGTGVGKTYVTCTLAMLARERGLQVVAHKPIETGCSMVDGKRRGDDQMLLRAASSLWLQEVHDEQVQYGSYQLELPLAPSVAAAREGVEIDLSQIQQVLDRAGQAPNKEPVDVFLVEGAGGWRVPITDRHEMRDLAKIVGGTVIVVGTAGLGTINHSLLTVEAVERDGFEVAALVLSNRLEDVEVQTNIAEIRKRWSGLVLTLGHLALLL